jgi:hypothetical protein
VRPTSLSSALLMVVELLAASLIVRIGWELGGRLWALLH